MIAVHKPGSESRGFHTIDFEESPATPALGVGQWPRGEEAEVEYSSQVEYRLGPQKQIGDEKATQLELGEDSVREACMTALRSVIHKIHHLGWRIDSESVTYFHFGMAAVGAGTMKEAVEVEV